MVMPGLKWPPDVAEQMTSAMIRPMPYPKPVVKRATTQTPCQYSLSDVWEELTSKRLLDDVSESEARGASAAKVAVEESAELYDCD
jgi:hypothetical protein